MGLFRTRSGTVAFEGEGEDEVEGNEEERVGGGSKLRNVKALTESKPGDPRCFFSSSAGSGTRNSREPFWALLGCDEEDEDEDEDGPLLP